MKNLNNSLKAAVLCCFLSASSIAVAQTVITIDNNPGSTTTFQTIQEAHDAASNGDIIYVQPSNGSYGAVTITKPLSIVGRSHHEPGKRSELSSVSLRSGGITLKGLYVSSIGSSLSSTPATPPFNDINIFECSASSITIGVTTAYTDTNYDNVAIIGNFIRSSISINADTGGVLVSSNTIIGGNFTTYNTTSAVFANNVFRASSTGANINLYNYSPSGTAILYNNMFIFNTSFNSLIVFQIGDFNLSNNLYYNYGTGNISFADTASSSFQESNTLANINPQFTDVDSTINRSFAGNSTYTPSFRPEDDLRLQAGSPALTGGGGGSEIGLYNNGFNYNIFGNPRNVPILDIESSDAAVQSGSNINVTVTAKAN